MVVSLLGPLALAVRRLERGKQLPAGSVWRCLALQSGWLLLWGALGLSGVLNVWDGSPPRALFALPVLSGMSVVLACSRLGQLLASTHGFTELYGFQVFRLPLEVPYRAMLVPAALFGHPLVFR